MWGNSRGKSAGSTKKGAGKEEEEEKKEGEGKKKRKKRDMESKRGEKGGKEKIDRIPAEGDKRDMRGGKEGTQRGATVCGNDMNFGIPGGVKNPRFPCNCWEGRIRKAPGRENFLEGGGERGRGKNI